MKWLFPFLFVSSVYAQDFSFIYQDHFYDLTVTVQSEECDNETKYWQETEGTYSAKDATEMKALVPKFVSETPCSDEAVSQIAGQLRSIFIQFPSTSTPDLDFANFVLAFVNSISYNYDIYNNGVWEYYQTPYQTITRKMGDCEDKSFLLATLYQKFGFDSLVIYYPGHAVAGIPIEPTDPERQVCVDFEDKKYYLCETVKEVPWLPYKMVGQEALQMTNEPDMVFKVPRN